MKCECEATGLVQTYRRRDKDSEYSRVQTVFRCTCPQGKFKGGGFKDVPVWDEQENFILVSRFIQMRIVREGILLSDGAVKAIANDSLQDVR